MHLRKHYALLSATVGAALAAGSIYVIETNGCWVPYLYQADEWPPSYGFWCVRFEPAVTGGLILGVLLVAGALIAGAVQLTKRLW